MGYFGKKKKEKYPKAFTSWVASNYGPPGRISADDIKQLFQEWSSQQGNALSTGAGNNALAN
jgi:hypothetical protein